MEPQLWGTHDEAKPLSASIMEMLEKVLGATAEQVNRIDPRDIALSQVRLSDADLGELAKIVGAEHVSTQHDQRLRRARGKSYPDLLDMRSAHIDAPDAVVAPATNEELAQLLQHCARERIAVVTFGGGTSVVGGITPKDGGLRAVISVDMARFTELSDVDPISGEATLGAGLTGPHAEMLLAEHGLQLGHFPQSFPYATIGGYAATRSSGQNSAGYGRFDEMVRSLTVVTPAGIIKAGWNAPQSAAGPDLRQLFLGSEGTLGIITSVRVRVHPIPETKRYEAFRFPDFRAGAEAMRAVTQTGTGATVLRLSDEMESAVNLSSTSAIGDSAASKNKGCLMLTMFEGTEAHTLSRHQETRELLLTLGGESAGEDPVRAWERGRFGAPVLRDGLMDNGAICETLETATDWSNLFNLKRAVTEAITKALADSGTIPLVMCHISHVYATGASLYFTIIGGQRGEPAQQWQPIKERACEAIIAAGGTISHHHAVGTDHRPYLPGEIGEAGQLLLQGIKAQLDPAGILNPGKLV
ncbi:FAD-linked oxidase C-terminal domain-containing protein [Corynebacterium lubricantis]|uniref:FAD-binding oxidoreductase n=1 Tax=Corynebacterium lubricantis TaxID=541095 RepID=UPI0003664719